MDPNKIKAITELPCPKNIDEIRVLVGMVNYYGKFIPNLSTILTPLYHLLQKNKVFNWTKQCEEAFIKKS